MRMRTPEEMAALLSERLTGPELLELQAIMDGREDALFDEVTRVSMGVADDALRERARDWVDGLPTALSSPQDT